MSELLPCPFQKEGETHDVRFVELKPGYGQIGCADCEFWFPSDDMLPFEEAKARWNTRHERTCRPHVVACTFAGHTEPSFWQAKCDCGWIVGEDGTPNLEEFEHIDDYCGGCGAKVVTG